MTRDGELADARLPGPGALRRRAGDRHRRDAVADPAGAALAGDLRRPGLGTDRATRHWPTRPSPPCCAAEPGSDHQLAWAHALLGAARSDEHVAFIRGLLDGTESVAGPGHRPRLALGARPRAVRPRRARPGRDRRRARPRPVQRRAAARGDRPRAAADRRGQADGLAARGRTTTSCPTAMQEAWIGGFAHSTQGELVKPYMTALLRGHQGRLGAAHQRDRAERRRSACSRPGRRRSPRRPSRPPTRSWPATTCPSPLRRLVSEGRADVTRALRARAVDAAQGRLKLGRPRPILGTRPGVIPLSGNVSLTRYPHRPVSLGFAEGPTTCRSRNVTPALHATSRPRRGDGDPGVDGAPTLHARVATAGTAVVTPPASAPLLRRNPAAVPARRDRARSGRPAAVRGRPVDRQRAGAQPRAAARAGTVRRRSCRAVTACPPAPAPATRRAAGRSRAKPVHAARRALDVRTAVISGLAANGIPTVALNAYRVAAARVDHADPGCGIDWALLAGIGREESNHGRFGGATLHDRRRLDAAHHRPGARRHGTGTTSRPRPTAGPGRRREVRARARPDAVHPEHLGRVRRRRERRRRGRHLQHQRRRADDGALPVRGRGRPAHRRRPDARPCSPTTTTTSTWRRSWRSRTPTAAASRSPASRSATSAARCRRSRAAATCRRPTRAARPRSTAAASTPKTAAPQARAVEVIQPRQPRSPTPSKPAPTAPKTSGHHWDARRPVRRLTPTPTPSPTCDPLTHALGGC